MKKLVNYRMCLSINGGEWQDTSIFNHIQYREECDCETWISKDLTFDEAVELVQADFVMNAECEKTLIGRKPKLKLSTSDCSLFGGPIYLTARTFKSLKIKKEYLPYNGTIKDIAALLTAEQFCEYLKAHGITQCPVLK